MCLIRQTRFYCNHIQTHKVNYCTADSSSSRSSSTSSSRSSSFSFTRSKKKSPSAAKKNTSGTVLTNDLIPDERSDMAGASCVGSACPQAKYTVCRTENRSCMFCKLGRGAVMGQLSMAGVRVIIKADSARK